MVTIEEIKKLREETGVSISRCKEALEETKGDLVKAKENLRKKGQELAEKRADKETGAGLVETYLHANHRLGVMISLLCESDFVARSEDFQNLAHEICLQIAAMKPLYLREEDIPAEKIEKEKEVYQESLGETDKPQEVVDKIIAGKLEKWKKEVVLLKQDWVKDSSKTIQQLLEEAVAKLGEKIEIRKFVRLEV
jgi:elongation factor Ts